MEQSRGQTIQAFPVHSGTFIGTASDLDATYKEVIHAAEDGTITMVFPTKTFDVDVLAGMDIAIGSGCKALTSTAMVWVS